MFKVPYYQPYQPPMLQNQPRKGRNRQVRHDIIVEHIPVLPPPPQNLRIEEIFSSLNEEMVTDLKQVWLENFFIFNNHPSFLALEFFSLVFGKFKKSRIGGKKFSKLNSKVEILVEVLHLLRGSA